MPPAQASTSKASKLTPLEQKIVKVGLAAPKGALTQQELFTQCGLTVSQSSQDAINSLLRKNLVVMMKASSGDIEFRFVGKDEAKQMGTMDSEEKLVYDQIKDSGNMGIWTKVLTSRTGLPRTTITKVLKTLEGRKSVKTVKSVKAPTRKIYMLANLTPSVELTGGPWFTDNELDTDFVDALKKCAYMYLQQKSRPPQPKTKSTPSQPKARPLFPTSATRHLPTVIEIREYIESLKVAVAVELLDEHVEALLELMIFDGTVEKVFINSDQSAGDSYAGGRGSKKRRRAYDDSDEEIKGRRKSTTSTKRARKKRKSHLIAAEEESEAETESDEYNSDEDAETARRRRNEKIDQGQQEKSSRRRKKRNLPTKIKRTDSDLEMGDNSSESSQSESEGEGESFNRRYKSGDMKDYVYRLIRPYSPVIGWTDMPCGKCPVESFCSEPRREFTPSTVKASAAGKAGVPKVEIGLEGGLQGVGMLGGWGAAIGVSTAKWGEVSGIVGKDVAPVNPRDCQYFKDWLDF